MNFLQNLEATILKNKSLVCIGLDTDIDKIKRHLLVTKSDLVTAFNKAIIDATADLVCCYKANIAFYSAHGISGLKSLIKTVDYIHRKYPHLPFILDAKRGDIGNTAEQYAKEVFDTIGVDAVTVNPYLGLDALVPFLKHKDKGIIILCRTSNPGAWDFQDLEVNGKPLYLKVAQKVVAWNKKYGNCLMVVGATWPHQLKMVRKIAPTMFLLVPGIGTQGGELKKTLEYGLTKEKSGLIIHVSRAIIYASNKKDFASVAREETERLRNEINRSRYDQ